MLKYLPLIGLLTLVPVMAVAQQPPREDHSIASAAYQQGLELGAAIQRQKDMKEIADLKAKIAQQTAPKE